MCFPVYFYTNFLPVGFKFFLGTILVLLLLQEKQTHHLRKLQEKVKTPEGVPRLFDLVKVKDEKLKLAFFATLGNTVAANDLDQVNP